MQEAVCKKCGRILPGADVFSWGVCKECDKAKGAAVKKLKYRRTLFGAFSVIAAVALGSLMLSWLIGPKEYGYYVLLTKSHSTKAHITYDTLWWMTAVVSVILGFNAFMFLVYRQRTKRAEDEWTDTSS